MATAIVQTVILHNVPKPKSAETVALYCRFRLKVNFYFSAATQNFTGHLARKLHLLKDTFKDFEHTDVFPTLVANV